MTGLAVPHDKKWNAVQASRKSPVRQQVQTQGLESTQSQSHMCWQVCSACAAPSCLMPCVLCVSSGRAHLQLDLARLAAQQLIEHVPQLATQH
jgi:hypothetical protein